MSIDFVSFFWKDGAGLVLYKFVLINIFVLVLISIFVFVSIDIFVADSIEAGRLGRKRGGSPRPNPPSHPLKTNLKQTNMIFRAKQILLILTRQI